MFPGPISPYGGSRFHSDARIKAYAIFGIERVIGAPQMIRPPAGDCMEVLRLMMVAAAVMRHADYCQSDAAPTVRFDRLLSMHGERPVARSPFGTMRRISRAPS